MRRLIFLLVYLVAASAVKASVISEVRVSCPQLDCSSIENRFKDFIGLPVNAVALRERVRFKLFDSSIKFLKYEVIEVDNKTVFHVTADLKPVINSITYFLPPNIRQRDIENFVRLSEGDFFDEILTRRAVNNLKKYFNDRGFADPDVTISAQTHLDRTDLTVNVELKDMMRVRDVFIVTTNPELVGRVRSKYAELRGQVLDKLKFRVITDQLSRELFESGFYESEVIALPEEHIEQTNEVILRVSVKYGSLYSFNFLGIHALSRNELINVVNERIKRGGVRAADSVTSGDAYLPGNDDCSNSEIAHYVKDAYLGIGAYETQVNCRVVRGKNKVGLEYVNFFFEITEGRKINVSRVNFKNNSALSRRDLMRLYRSHATGLASSGFLDEKFVKSFPQIVKREYLKNGYVQVQVLEPELNFNNEENSVEINFTVIERPQVIVSQINLLNDLEDLRESVLDKMNNRIGLPINIPVIEQDFGIITRAVQEAGYYFAEISNFDDENFVEYNNSITEASINVEFNALKLAILNSVIVTGYNKTQLTILTREIHLSEGDKIAPSDVIRIRDALISLDLFSNVRITPFVLSSEDDDNFLVNLLVQVDEKDFGVAEVAPGYRTDLGLKLGVGVTYNNLWGMNRIATLKAEGNRRFDYGDFDTRRRAEKKQLIEYSVRGSFTEPYLLPDLFKTKLQFDVAIATQRKRFVSFDADIFRVSPQLTKGFFDNVLTVSLRYQFETIKQFDATNLVLNDNFTIGSLTPAATIDFRNDPIRPTKGSLFNLSWEFANPYFLSMDNEDLTVNYYRLISRNHFYVPVSDFMTLAFSASGGVQKNFARGGEV
jgi:outer membrane protein insertion porin family